MHIVNLLVYIICIEVKLQGLGLAAAQAAEKRLDNLQATAIQIKSSAEQAVEARAEMLGPFISLGPRLSSKNTSNNN